MSGLHAAMLVITWLACVGTATGRSTPLVEVMQDRRLVQVGQAGQVRHCIQYGWVGGDTLRDLGGDQLPTARALQQQQHVAGLAGAPMLGVTQLRLPGPPSAATACIAVQQGQPTSMFFVL